MNGQMNEHRLRYYDAIRTTRMPTPYFPQYAAPYRIAVAFPGMDANVLSFSLGEQQAGDCREAVDVVVHELCAALRMSMEMSAGTALVEASKVGNLSEVKRLLARPDAKDFLNATESGYKLHKKFKLTDKKYQKWI
jgi:hypothetical protein